MLGSLLRSGVRGRREPREGRAEVGRGGGRKYFRWVEGSRIDASICVSALFYWGLMRFAVENRKLRVSVD